MQGKRRKGKYKKERKRETEKEERRENRAAPSISRIARAEARTELHYSFSTTGSKGLCSDADKGFPAQFLSCREP